MVKQTFINRLRQKFVIRRKPPSSRPSRPNNNNLSKSLYNKLKPLLNLELSKKENKYNRLFKLYSNMKNTRHLHQFGFTEKHLQTMMPQLALANAMLESGFPKKEAIKAMQLSPQQATNARVHQLPVLLKRVHPERPPYHPPSPKPSPKRSPKNSIPLRDSRLPKHTADTAEGVIPYRTAASTVRGTLVFL